MNKNISSILKSVSKPARYSGGEFGSIIKNKALIETRWAFCFPDTYEIGMSNLGVRLLYGVLNEQPEIWCERVYAPWVDMEEKMREYSLPLVASESGDPLLDFDIVAFTLQYEMCYTNVLNMLELAHIPLLASERDNNMPIIIGGGPCTYNAEPLVDFFDCFSIGEGEDMLVEFSKFYTKVKKEGNFDRVTFLHRAAREIKGLYVPSLYEVSYNDDGTIKEYKPKYNDIPTKITKRIMADMDKSFYPENVVLPYIETVHDRIVLEVFRGCIRGCRFCQAGMVYRPVREKSPEVLSAQAKCLYDTSGYDEISLSSLSISDYSKLRELTDLLLEWTEPNMVSLSLPSLRVDSFTKELMDRVASVRSSSLTFAPEAGTQRLRDVINKNIDEVDLMNAINVAFDAGKSVVKLYFMNGLPTETFEDIEGIATLAQKVVDAYYKNPSRSRGKSPTVTVSVSCFVPKPFTPFQWEAQDTLEMLNDKQHYLYEKITDRKIKYKYHDAKLSIIEAAFARGDRRLCSVLLKAHEYGFKFDAWDEYFNYEKWVSTFKEVGIDPSFYANRKIGLDEVLPWDIIDCGVCKEFLLREREMAYEEKTSKSCMESCNGCGVNKLGGDNRWCPTSPKADCPQSERKPFADITLREKGTEYELYETPQMVRVKFCKTGAAQYMSHLDLQRTFVHVLNRARLPLWYTQGYNPRMKMVFSTPLPVGAESVCEYLDLRLERKMPLEEIMKRLNHELTEEMRVLQVYFPQSKFSDIGFSEYEYKIVTTNMSDELAKKIDDTLHTSPIKVMKHSKSGDKLTDIYPLIEKINVKYDEENKCIFIIALLSAGGDSYLNPEHIMTFLKEQTGILAGNMLDEYYSILRQRLICTDKITEFN